MSTKINKVQDVKFGKVSIVHLSSILDKEKTKNKPSLKQDRTEDIMKHVGLPLSVAHYEKQMIGYGFVLINSSGEVEFNYHFEEEYDTVEIKKGLEAEAEKTFKILFNKNSTKADAVQNAIHKLANWINQC